jgi:hypothetical protein
VLIGLGDQIGSAGVVAGGWDAAGRPPQPRENEKFQSVSSVDDRRKSAEATTTAS